MCAHGSQTPRRVVRRFALVFALARGVMGLEMDSSSSAASSVLLALIPRLLRRRHCGTRRLRWETSSTRLLIPSTTRIRNPSTVHRSRFRRSRYTSMISAGLDRSQSWRYFRPVDLLYGADTTVYSGKRQNAGVYALYRNDSQTCRSLPATIRHEPRRCLPPTQDRR